MKFVLKFLYCNGVALPMEELVNAPPYVGNLIIKERWQGDGSARYIREARLPDLTVSQAPHDLVPPLFDPQLVKMQDDRMVLNGFQIHADMEAGSIMHFVQVWMLSPVGAE